MKTLAMAIILSVTMLAARGAHATYYGFNFGSGITGNFITGSAGEDSGYFLVTSLTFTTITITPVGDLSPVTFTNEAATSFAPDAAYNPTADQFENYTGGIFNEDFGRFKTKDLSIGDPSFENSATGLVGELLPFGPDFVVNQPLTIINYGSGAPIPEPGAALLLLTGLPAVLLVRRRVPRPVAPG